MRSISVDKGDSVRANQVIAVIESPETDKQYQAAVADAHNKELIANRAATLVKKEMISQQDADQAEADAAVSKANLEQIGTLKSYEAVARSVQRNRHRALFRSRRAHPERGHVADQRAAPGRNLRDVAAPHLCLRRSGARPVRSQRRCGHDSRSGQSRSESRRRASPAPAARSIPRLARCWSRSTSTIRTTAFLPAASCRLS